MCDKAVDSYLLALKIVPDWFINKMTVKEVQYVELQYFLGIYKTMFNMDNKTLSLKCERSFS